MEMTYHTKEEIMETVNNILKEELRNIDGFKERMEIMEANEKRTREDVEIIKASFNPKEENLIREFSKKTHFHGFIEFYESKTKKGKYFWLFIIVFSMLISSYQIAMGAVDFFSTPVATVVTHVTNSQMLFPTLQICYDNWLQWFDFRKALSENFTKEDISFALSFYDIVYLEKNFNLTYVFEEFPKKLIEHNLTDMDDFYSYYTYPNSYLNFYVSSNLQHETLNQRSDAIYCQTIKINNSDMISFPAMPYLQIQGGINNTNNYAISNLKGALFIADFFMKDKLYLKLSWLLKIQIVSESLTLIYKFELFLPMS